MEALTIPVKLYVHYLTAAYSQEKYMVATCDMSRSFPDQYVLLETLNISININQPEPIDIIALQVDQLRNKKDQIIAAAQREITTVEDKIQQLLCIDHSPIEENEVPF